MIDELVVHSVTFGEPPLTSYRPSQSVEVWRRPARFRSAGPFTSLRVNLFDPSATAIS